MEVKQTNVYDMFSYIKGNRPVTKVHVNMLVKAISNKNLLHLAPILVNKSMQVIDGQHRLEAAKVLKVPVYYMVDSDATSNDAKVLNTVINKWNLRNFIDAYVEKGNDNYIKLKQLMEDYPCAPAIVAGLLRSVEGNDTMRGMHNVIKDGSFVVKDYTKAEEVLGELSEFDKYCKKRFNFNREFVLAYVSLRKQVEPKAFLKMLEKVKPLIEAQVTWRQYLVIFERIYFRATKKSIHL